MSREICRRWVVSYDIADDARRGRMAHTILAYGDRLQYSVFVVDVPPASFIRLKRSLLDLMDPLTDSLLLCDLGPLGELSSTRFQAFGRPRPLLPPGAIIF